MKVTPFLPVRTAELHVCMAKHACVSKTQEKLEDFESFMNASNGRRGRGSAPIPAFSCLPERLGLDAVKLQVTHVCVEADPPGVCRILGGELSRAGIFYLFTRALSALLSWVATDDEAGRV